MHVIQGFILQGHLHEFTIREIRWIKAQHSGSLCTQKVSFSDSKDDQHNRPPRSTEQKLTHPSFQEVAKCVICTAVKRDAHGKAVPVQAMTFWENQQFLTFGWVIT